MTGNEKAPDPQEAEPLLCKFGIHRWSLWAQLKRDNPGLSFDYVLSQERKCLRCGLTQMRKWQNFL